MDKITKEHQEEILKKVSGEKNLYPSQINTKTISCRISAVDYVQFLNDAISKGISLNDWLLTKIYSNSIGNVSKNENKEGLLKIYDFLKEEEFYKRWKEEEQEEDWNGIKIDSPEGIIQLIRNLSENVEELLKFQNFLLDEKIKSKKPNLDNIKAQILTIAQTKIKGRDLKEFMFDVNELLEELV